MASAIRAVHGDIDFAQPLTGQLNQLGEPLYRKLEPTGYSNRSADWTNSASLLARMNFALALAQGKIPGVRRHQRSSSTPHLSSAAFFSPSRPASRMTRFRPGSHSNSRQGLSPRDSPSAHRTFNAGR